LAAGIRLTVAGAIEHGQKAFRSNDHFAGAANLIAPK